MLVNILPQLSEVFLELLLRLCINFLEIRKFDIQRDFFNNFGFPVCAREDGVFTLVAHEAQRCTVELLLADPGLPLEFGVDRLNVQ